MNNNEKRVVSIFKSYIEKLFVPTFKKNDGLTAEWNKMNLLLANYDVTVYDLQIYVDSVGQIPQMPAFMSKEQIPVFKKKKDDNLLDSVQLPPQENGISFNPSKTFGGERARLMFQKVDDDHPQYPSTNSTAKEDMFKRPPNINSQVLIPGLYKLCKMFIDNQQRIEYMLLGANKPTY